MDGYWTDGVAEEEQEDEEEAIDIRLR